MKKAIVVIFLLFALSIIAWGQFAFSIKPGLNMNGASFGIKVSKLVIFGGLDYTHISSTFEESGTEIDWTYNSQYISPYGWVYTYGYQLNPYSDKYEASLNLYAPTLGIKLLLGGPEKVDAYLTASISKPIITGKASSNGKEEDVQKYLDNLSVWGYQFGFGGEYFFSDNFSIGGEFGFRIFSVNYEQEDKNQETVMVGSSISGYQNEEVETTQKYNFSLGLGITYSVLCLNYYF